MSTNTGAPATAVRDGPIHHEKPPRTVTIKCVYPACTTHVQVPSPPEGVAIGSTQHMMRLGGIPLCAKHAEMLGFYIWCQTNLKFEAQKTPSGLVLPGHETFKPTLPGGRNNGKYA